MTAADTLASHWEKLERRLGASLDAFRNVPDIRRCTSLVHTMETRTAGLLNDITDLKTNKAPAQAWPSIDRVSKSVEGLIGECLAIMLGVAGAGICGDLCSIAEGLAAEFSRKADIAGEHLVLSAASSSFTDLSEVIRIDFGDDSIAALPIVAHEWGHYWSRRWLELSPVRFDPYSGWAAKYDTSFSKNRLDFSKNHLSELFADFWGTYVLGPAYAYSCFTVHLRPTMAESDSHPSAAQRAFWILHLTRGAHPAVAGLLEKIWITAGGKVDSREGRLADAADELGATADRYRVALKYGAAGRASRLANEFGRVEPRTIGLADCSIADVANAYWIFREQNLADAGRRKTAETICLELARNLAGRQRTTEVYRWQTA